jgi:prepilin-type N-terminal cleavage/methylation domain-containing protein
VNERGFTLLELLVAAAIGTIVLFGLGGLYQLATRYNRLDDQLAYLQRQGTLVLDKMGRRIREASEIKCSPLATCDPVAADPASTCGVDPSLQVTAAGTTVCFRLNTTGGNDLIQASGAGQSSMLTGNPVTLTVSECPGVPMFSVSNPTNPPGCSTCAPPNQADVCFQLSTTSVPPDSVIFRASFTKRN